MTPAHFDSNRQVSGHTVASTVPPPMISRSPGKERCAFNDVGRPLLGTNSLDLPQTGLTRASHPSAPGKGLYDSFDTLEEKRNASRTRGDCS